MKKVVSLILTLAMVFAMSTTALADPVHVVGTHGENNAVTDGVEPGSFSSTDPSTDIKISVSTGEVQHRYAVDITYDVMSFNITGSNLVWNVNTLKYESEPGAAALENVRFNVAVTNYSDLPVYLTANAEKEADASSDINIAVVEDNTETALAAKAEIADATSGTAQVLNFDVYVSSSNWDAVANYYLPKFDADTTSVDIGTVSVTVAKNNT